MSSVGLRKLCTPAYVYLVISAIAIIVMAAQNIGNSDIYCIGSYSCGVTSTVMIFIIKILYVLFWTWVLNIICSAGASNVAWFLVLLPYLLLFIFIALMMMS
jgi:hypothetical protein